VRAAVLALALMLASPARAEEGEALRRGWHRRGVTLTAVGLGFAAVGVAGLLVLATTGTCGNTFGDYIACALPHVEAGEWMAGGGFGVALPLLASGVTLLRLHEPPSRRRARDLVIAGSVLTAAGMALAGTAFWAGYNDWPEHETAWRASTATASVTGAVGLALLSVGATLYGPSR
jgi:uncharacterized BrkB/YihY/UPF0761 family membrane protein